MKRAKSRLARRPRNYARSRLNQKTTIKIDIKWLFLAFFSGFLAVIIAQMLPPKIKEVEIIKEIEVITPVEVIKEIEVFSGYQPKNEIEELLCAEKYDWNCEIMSAIAKEESRQRCDINNAGLNRNGSIDYGVLQINSVHNFDYNQIYDCEYNIERGYKIWLSQGYRAWSSFNSGAYIKHL